MRRSMGALGIACMMLAGCVSNPLTRAQMAEEKEKETDLSVLTVGDVTFVDNVEPIVVQGVGLVRGLAGTGHSPDGYYRKLLEQYLLKTIGTRRGEIVNDEPHITVKKLLDSPENAMVIVTGRINAGVRRGERFDIEVTLPPGSKTSSLAGGYLEVCQLRLYARKSSLNASEKFARDNTLLGSNVIAQAKGPLVVGFGNNTDAHELRRGEIWLGGLTRIDRPYAFVLRMDEKLKSIRLTNHIAENLNLLYQDDPHSKPVLNEQQKYHMQLVENMTDQLNQQANLLGQTEAEMAKAVDKNRLHVRVPFIYRHNHERYMLVARQTPLQVAGQNLGRYKQRLQKMLLDPREPRDVARAAVRLEALGRDSIPILKAGLQSEHLLVRFCSAEAMAYLGNTAGVDALVEAAQTQPVFAYHACLALNNLHETVCLDRLKELLNSAEPAVRCAAFHALSLDDEKEPRLAGYHLSDKIWVYNVPLSTTPTVYYSTSSRPQVILFGRNVALAPDIRMTVGDFTVVTVDDRCTIKRITTRGEVQRTCTSQLDDILVTLGTCNATYPDIVNFLRKVQDLRGINCPIVQWTTPEVTLETLIQVAGGK